MQQFSANDTDHGITEMVIVDIFTRLIFGEVDEFSARDLLIIQAFRGVDINVLSDTYSEMGAYLRNLGVREMIERVSTLREYMHGDTVGFVGRTGQAVTSIGRCAEMPRRCTH